MSDMQTHPTETPRSNNSSSKWRMRDADRPTNQGRVGKGRAQFRSPTFCPSSSRFVLSVRFIVAFPSSRVVCCH